jgi:hypothetical protein
MRFSVICLTLLLLLSLVSIVGIGHHPVFLNVEGLPQGEKVSYGVAGVKIERLEVGKVAVAAFPLSESHSISNPNSVLVSNQEQVLCKDCARAVSQEGTLSFQYTHSSATPTISISPTTCQACVQTSMHIIGAGFIPNQTGYITIDDDPHAEYFMTDATGAWSHDQAYKALTPGTKKVLAGQTLFTGIPVEAIAYLTVTGPAPCAEGQTQNTMTVATLTTSGITTGPTSIPIAPVTVTVTTRESTIGLPLLSIAESIAAICIVIILAVVVLRKRAKPSGD